MSMRAVRRGEVCVAGQYRGAKHVLVPQLNTCTEAAWCCVCCEAWQCAGTVLRGSTEKHVLSTVVHGAPGQHVCVCCGVRGCTAQEHAAWWDVAVELQAGSMQGAAAAAVMTSARGQGGRESCCSCASSVVLQHTCNHTCNHACDRPQPLPQPCLDCVSPSPTTHTTSPAPAHLPRASQRQVVEGACSNGRHVRRALHPAGRALYLQREVAPGLAPRPHIACGAGPGHSDDGPAGYT